MARQVQSLLPGEDLVYFGDGANVPYGNYGAPAIEAMSRNMFRFMEERKVKALLVACNTISCVAHLCMDEVSCPVFNAVQAGAEAAVQTAEKLQADRIGVISTVFTHSTSCYPERLRELAPNLRVFSRGCPDLAQLVEQHLCDPGGMAHVEAAVCRELDPLVKNDKIQCCVLGCTHYSLVEDRIRGLYPGLPLVDPAMRMATELRSYLEESGLLRTPERGGRLDIYTTGDAEEYRDRARRAGLWPISSVVYHPGFPIP